MNEQQLYYQILGEVVFNAAKQTAALQAENEQLRIKLREMILQAKESATAKAE